MFFLYFYCVIFLVGVSLASTLTIASFGGSITWGSGLGTGERAWPVLLGYMYEDAGYEDVRVYNYAMRAKGSFSAAMCLLDMLRSPPLKTFNSGNRLVQHEPLAGPVDIIILEYSINGVQEIELLMMKLQLQFPQARIVFMAMFALEAEIRVCNETESVMRRNGPKPNLYTTEMCWVKRHSLYRAGVSKAHKNNIPVVNFPYRAKPIDHLADFASDWHHLNEGGHAIAASLLYAALDMQESHVWHKQMFSALSGTWKARLAKAGYDGEKPILEKCVTFKNRAYVPLNWTYEVDSDAISFATTGLAKSNAIAASKFNVILPAAFDGANVYIQFKTAANTPDYGYINIATEAMSVEIDTKALSTYKHHAYRIHHVGVLQCSSTENACEITISAHGRETVRLTGFYINPYVRLFY